MTAVIYVQNIVAFQIHIDCGRNQRMTGIVRIYANDNGIRIRINAQSAGTFKFLHLPHKGTVFAKILIQFLTDLVSMLGHLVNLYHLCQLGFTITRGRQSIHVLRRLIKVAGLVEFSFVKFHCGGCHSKAAAPPDPIQFLIVHAKVNTLKSCRIPLERDNVIVIIAKSFL